MRVLARTDIVDKRIARVLQTPWQEFDGIFACAVFVKLENGDAFELAGHDDEQAPVPAVDLSLLRLIPAEFPPDVKTCDGETVKEV